MTSSIEVKELGPEDLAWPFRTGMPEYHGAKVSTALDPMPAYGHDVGVVRRMLTKVAARFDLGVPLTVHISHLEETSRTNAFAFADRSYDADAAGDDKWRRSAAHIFLSAKRIQPHPAMTRHLVAHEYGHQVQYALEERLGLSRDALHELYSDLRGLGPAPTSYGGGTWHRSPGEVFACDFRIVVCGVETEYWPHPGVPRPEEVPAVAEWWALAVGTDEDLAMQEEAA